MLASGDPALQRFPGEWASATTSLPQPPSPSHGRGEVRRHQAHPAASHPVPRAWRGPLTSRTAAPRPRWPGGAPRAASAVLPPPTLSKGREEAWRHLSWPSRGRAGQGGPPAATAVPRLPTPSSGRGGGAAAPRPPTPRPEWPRGGAPRATTNAPCPPSATAAKERSSGASRGRSEADTAKGAPERRLRRPAASHPVQRAW